MKLENETVWLTQAQMVKLFKRDQSVISRHINAIFKEQEVDKKSNMHFLHIANSDKPVAVFSLDVIISVGYRVKSKQGTQFRIWANKVLKEYLIKGYTINEQRLRDQAKQLDSLKEAVQLLGNVLQQKDLNSEEATGLLKVVTDYTFALDILDKYDHQQLVIEGTTGEQLFVISYEEAMKAIKDLKEKFGGSSLFGNEKDESFKGSIGTIYQSFGGYDLYPSVEEKANGSWTKMASFTAKMVQNALLTMR